MSLFASGRQLLPWDYFRVARENEAARAADATACVRSAVVVLIVR